MGTGAMAILLAYELCMFTATQYGSLGYDHGSRIRLHKKAVQRCEQMYNGEEPSETKLKSNRVTIQKLLKHQKGE